MINYKVPEISEAQSKEPLCNMSLLPVNSDFINFLDGLQSVLSYIPVISLWPITLPLEFKC